MEVSTVLTAALAGGGVSLLAEIIRTLAMQRKTDAEIHNLDAMGDKLRGETWQQACAWLAADAKNLRERVSYLEEEVAELLRGIEMLLRQIRHSGEEPDWTPPPCQQERPVVEK